MATGFYFLITVYSLALRTTDCQGVQKYDEAARPTSEVIWINGPLKAALQSPASAQAVLGRENQTVQVLIPVHGPLVTLVCLTSKLAKTVIFNPSTEWWDERNMAAPVLLQGEGAHYRQQMDGTLVLLDWKDSKLSGLYSCRLSYRDKTTVHTVKLRFALLAYHSPVEVLKVSSTLQTSTCDQRFIQNSINKVNVSLSFICAQVLCELVELTFNCRQTGAHKTHHELELSLTVQPKHKIQRTLCKKPQACMDPEILKQAYGKIRSFLTKSHQVLQSANDVPPLFYNQGTFKALRVNHCLEGMGKTYAQEIRCPQCCVACQPGFFSSNMTTSCIVCSYNSYQDNYGQTKCKSCPPGYVTWGHGSTYYSDCREEELFSSRPARMSSRGSKSLYSDTSTRQSSSETDGLSKKIVKTVHVEG